MENSIAQESVKKRGFFLTVSLIWATFINAFEAINNLTITFHPSFFQLSLGLSHLLEFAFSLAVWKWKKWGLLGMAAVSVMENVFIATKGNLQTLVSCLLLEGAIFVIIFIIPAWGKME